MLDVKQVTGSTRDVIQNVNIYSSPIDLQIFFIHLQVAAAGKYIPVTGRCIKIYQIPIRFL